jgi:hypothetical protein
MGRSWLLLLPFQWRAVAGSNRLGVPVANSVLGLDAFHSRKPKVTIVLQSRISTDANSIRSKVPLDERPK